MNQILRGAGDRDWVTAGRILATAASCSRGWTERQRGAPRLQSGADAHRAAMLAGSLRGREQLAAASRLHQALT